MTLLSSAVRRLRSSPAVVISSLSLFVVLGSTATAAIVVTGRDVQDGSLTGRDVRDGSLYARDLSPAVQRLLLRAPRDGADGRDGVDGIDGRDGAPGAAGRDGRAGRGGADGAIGPAGRAGADGAPGSAGRDGSNGRDGATGPAGRGGSDGASGRDGSDGETGPAGRDGAPGRDGATGPAGRDGADGAPGRDGAPGPAGQDGAQGEAGPSDGLLSTRWSDEELAADAGPKLSRSWKLPTDGAYLVTVAATLTGSDAKQPQQRVGCRLSSPEAEQPLLADETYALLTDVSAEISLQAAVGAKDGRELVLSCESEATILIRDLSLSAIRVGALHLDGEKR